MAEGGFEISVPVIADLSQFRQQVRAAMEEAAKGFSIPVRGRDPGGQGATAPVTYAQAEQRAVEQAMAMAQRQSGQVSGASAYASGSQSGGQGWTPRIDTNDAQIAMNRLRGIWQEVRSFVEKPIKITVDASGAEAGMAGARAAGRGRAPNSREAVFAGADTYANQGPSARERGGSRYTPAGGMDLHPGLAETQDRLTSLREQFDAMSPPPAPGASQAGTTRRAQGRQQAAGGNTFGLPTNSIRGLLGMAALGEIGNSITALRAGNADAQWASSPEERALIQAQALKTATGGFFGSAMAFIPDMLDSDYSPDKLVRNAKSAVEGRQMEKQSRDVRFATEGSVAYRSGLQSGGRAWGDYQRQNVERKKQIDDLKLGISDAEKSLDDRTAIVTENVSAGMGGRGFQMTSGGEYVLAEGSDKRRETRRRLEEDRKAIKSATADKALADREAVRQRDDSRLASDNAIARAGEVARGATDRELEQSDILRKASERATAYAERYGDAGEGKRRNADEVKAEQKAAEFLTRRDDQFEAAGLQARAQITRLGSQNRPGEAAILGAYESGRKEFVAAKRAGKGPDVIAGINANMASDIGGVIAGQARNFGNQQAQLDSQNAAMSQMLNRNPLGAQITGIRAQRDAALRDASSQLPGFRQMTEFAIRRNSAQQEQLADREFGRGQFETGESLDAANRQSRLRQAGGNNRIDAQLDQITTDAARDVRSLRDQGKDDPRVQANIVRRNMVAVNQIRESQDDYFRSIQFAEVSGGRIAAGQGNPFADVRKKFADAEDRVGKGKDAPEADQLPAKVDAVIDLLKMYLPKAFTARAGP